MGVVWAHTLLTWARDRSEQSSLCLTLRAGTCWIVSWMDHRTCLGALKRRQISVPVSAVLVQCANIWPACRTAWVVSISDCTTRFPKRESVGSWCELLLPCIPPQRPCIVKHWHTLCPRHHCYAYRAPGHCSRTVGSHWLLFRYCLHLLQIFLFADEGFMPTNDKTFGMWRIPP